MAALMMVLSAAVAQAAVIQSGSAAEPAPSALGSSNRGLDKALGGDLSTGDRNLDLLLESQRKGSERPDEVPAARPLPDRPGSGRGALQPLPEAAPAVPPAALPPDVGRRYESTLILPEHGQLANPGLPTPKAARDWSGGGGQAVSGATGSAGASGSIYGDTSRLRSAVRPLHEWFQDVLAYLKDHVIVIVLAGAAIALLGMGLKAYSRRI